MRQSPSSSRHRSMTTVRSSGIAPVAARSIGQVLQEVGGSGAIEIVLPLETVERRSRRQLRELSSELSDRHPEFQRPARRVAFPERHLARLPRCRRHGARGRG